MTDDERMSALLDGECELEPEVIKRLASDPDLRNLGRDYQTVGDLLRGHATPHFDTVRFQTRLAAEPVVMVGRGRRSVSLKMAWPSWQTGLSTVAASVAVVLVSSLVWPPQGGTELNSDAAGVAVVPKSVVGAPSAAAPNASLSPGIHEYLLAHEPVAGSFMSRDAGNFVRPVADVQSGSRLR